MTGSEYYAIINEIRSGFNSEETRKVIKDTVKVEIIRDYFEEHYSCPTDESPLEPFKGPPRLLNSPITAEEVQKAASKLRNNKAVGLDGIPNELLKHATASY